MRSHFEKYAFIHHILVSNCIATPYAKTYYCFCFVIADTSKIHV